MNKYVCFWIHSSKSIEVEAATSYAAQLSAIFEFQKNTRKKVKGSDITVTLAEKNNKPVIHTPSF